MEFRRITYATSAYLYGSRSKICTYDLLDMSQARYYFSILPFLVELSITAIESNILFNKFSTIISFYK